MAFCLARAGITIDEVDHVGFYDKPLLKFERILETYLAIAPRGFGSFMRAGPLWIREKLFKPDDIANELGYEGDILFAEHHGSDYGELADSARDPEIACRVPRGGIPLR